jgi:hypothetical protein
MHRASRFGVDELVQTLNVIRRTCYAATRTEGRFGGRAEGIFAAVATKKGSIPSKGAGLGLQDPAIWFGSFVFGALPVSPRNRSLVGNGIAGWIILALHPTTIVARSHGDNNGVMSRQLRKTN